MSATSVHTARGARSQEPLMWRVEFPSLFHAFFPSFFYFLLSPPLHSLSGMLAPHSPLGETILECYKLRVAQPVPHGLHAGEGGVRGGAALQGLRRRGAGPQGDGPGAGSGWGRVTAALEMKS